MHLTLLLSFVLLNEELNLYRSPRKSDGKIVVLWLYVTKDFGILIFKVNYSYGRFMTLRYSAIVALFGALWYSSFQSNHCQVAVLVNQVASVIAITSSGAAFGYSVMAVWDNHKVIAGVVGCNFIAMVAAWVCSWKCDHWNFLYTYLPNLDRGGIAIPCYKRPCYNVWNKLPTAALRILDSDSICRISRILHYNSWPLHVKIHRSARF